MTFKRNPTLERELVARPDDLELKLVYADWLQQHGDPWGELIVRQQHVGESARPLFIWDDPAGWKHAVRQKPIDNALYAQYSGSLGGDDPAGEPDDELAAELRAEILGDQRIRLRWRHGFVDKVFFPQRVSHDLELETALDRLLSHRSSLLLRELALGAINWRTGGKWNGRVLHYQPEIEVILGHGPPCLRRLVLGAWQEHDVSWTAVGDLGELSGCLPELTALELQGNDMDFGDVDLPRLRRLVVRSGGLPEEAIAQLARASWPSLEELELWFGDEDYGGSPSVAVAEPFLDADRLPRLRRLGLRNAMFTDDLCALLPTASILPRLIHLDLSMGTMSDQGARDLLARPQAFAHLERLDLRDNNISPGLCSDLAALCHDVDTAAQSDRRYVSVGE
jgi:uncharacterized protein (TIGR02996 family)